MHNLESCDVIDIQNVLPSYKDMLTNVNHVLNLLEDLEAGKSWSEYFSDWQIGERLNVKRMRANLEKVKMELENGMTIYTKYIFRYDHSKRIQKAYRHKLESSVSESTVAIYEERSMDFFREKGEDLSNAKEKLSRIGIFKGKERKIAGCVGQAVASGVLATSGASIGIGIAGAGILATGLIPVSLGVVGVAVAGALFAGVVSSVAYAYNYPKGKGRAIQYQELNYLYNELHDDKTLAVFQTHHKTIDILTGELNGVGESCNELYQIALKLSPPNNDKLTASPFSYYNKAMELYKDTYKEEVQELTGPEMSEEHIAKHATRAAVRVCKRFLIDQVRCSDSEANDFIKNLQS